MPADAFAEAPAEAPADAFAEAPADAFAEAPADAPVEAPADAFAPADPVEPAGPAHAAPTSAAPAVPAAYVPAAPASPSARPAHARPSTPVVLKRKQRRVLREIVEILVIIAIAVVVTTLLRTFVIDNYEIPTGSMEPTIAKGDRLFAEKVTYYFGEPVRGEIVTFDDPTNDDRVLIKRCIATGGQTIDLRDGKVIVDGIILDEPYTHDKPTLPLDPMPGQSITYPYTVPKGSVWMMGDNRTNSLDSRYFGPVPSESLIGKALFRMLPLDRFGPID
jgi:signal peptidase I